METGNINVMPDVHQTLMLKQEFSVIFEGQAA